jgi:ribosomal protein S18 acetylase RimI-like enzyme
MVASSRCRHARMRSSLSVTTPVGELTLRPEADDGSDEAFLFDLFASVKAPEMALMPIDERGREQLLRMQYRSMTTSYRVGFPSARFDIIELDHTRIGRLVTDVQPDHVYYVDIALLPHARGRGIGTSLMRAALEEPRCLGMPCRVKVMTDNIASLRLWARLGFTLRAEIPPQVELEWRAPA